MDDQYLRVVAGTGWEDGLCLLVVKLIVTDVVALAKEDGDSNEL